ncbi:type I restriction modification system HsdS component [Candidatus Mycoplasma haematolamae str. Purdue]|uniref:Type I restriction modification system HsdS component n=1 Tax=Mycoplasma haematolamae (strain Purdue) TaxID=1212765 RepID=I7CIH0_MYCHA|nr:restriction endonuclease subunit S [Candidatus Mycoplasma haematolamae]AFO51654.1 type I restriction modification system HsdS component [Candidatus Mycoplasma haematolamae str. Purdue]
MKLVELGEVIQIYKGRKPLNLSDSPDIGLLPYIDIKALKTDTASQFARPDKCVLANQGDVLIVWDGASCGLVGKSPAGLVGSTLARVRSRELTPDFLFYYLQDKFLLLNTRTKGSTIPHLDKQILLGQKILLLSLDDQQKLVEPLVLLDAEGGASSAFKSSADSIKKQFSRKAFEGKLTANWRKEHPEHSPLRDFESIRLKRQKFKDKNIEAFELDLATPAEWLECRVGDVFLTKVGTTPSKKVSSYWGGQIPFVVGSDINWDCLKNSNEFLTQEGLESKSLQIYPADTVFLSIRKNIKASISRVPCSCSVGVVAIQTAKTPCITEYLFYFFQLMFQGQNKFESGSNHETLNQEKVRSLHFPFTSFAEQKEVVREIESRFALVSSIEKLQNDFELLKKVALKETFSLLEGS